MPFAGNFKQMLVYVSTLGRARGEGVLSQVERSRSEGWGSDRSQTDPVSATYGVRAQASKCVDSEGFSCKTAAHGGSATVGAQQFELYTLFELRALSLWSFSYISLLIISPPLSACSTGINLPSPAGLILDLGHLKMTQLLHHGSSRSPHPDSGPPVNVGADLSSSISCMCPRRSTGFTA